MTGQILLAWLKLLALVILSFGVSQGCDLRSRVEDGVRDAIAAA
jgi:hypothetical protein